MSLGKPYRDLRETSPCPSREITVFPSKFFRGAQKDPPCLPGSLVWVAPANSTSSSRKAGASIVPLLMPVLFDDRWLRATGDGPLRAAHE